MINAYSVLQCIHYKFVEIMIDWFSAKRVSEWVCAWVSESVTDWLANWCVSENDSKKVISFPTSYIYICVLHSYKEQLSGCRIIQISMVKKISTKHAILIFCEVIVPYYLLISICIGMHVLCINLSIDIINMYNISYFTPHPYRYRVERL